MSRQLIILPGAGSPPKALSGRTRPLAPAVASCEQRPPCEECPERQLCCQGPLQGGASGLRWHQQSSLLSRILILAVLAFLGADSPFKLLLFSDLGRGNEVVLSQQEPHRRPMH